MSLEPSATAWIALLGLATLYEGAALICTARETE